MAKRDYYEVLGVQKGASAEDIKKATAFAIRSSQGSFYIPDEMIKKETRTEWQFRKLGNGLNSGNSYILILGGS